MGKYFCQCGEDTDVVETRISYARIRRRRKCQKGHTFSTVEVPHSSPKELKELMNWLKKQGVDPDIISYAKEQIGVILLGKQPDDGEDHDN